jgi:hypothetical protein
MPAQGSAKAMQETPKQSESTSPRGRTKVGNWLRTWTQVLVAEVLSALELANSLRNN